VLSIKLTPGQRSAIEIYVTDPAHADDFPEASLHGSILTFDSSYDRAADILIEASNSADVGDNRTRDSGAVKAIDNVLAKLRKLRPASRP
jgi:hypothetical protein